MGSEGEGLRQVGDHNGDGTTAPEGVHIKTAHLCSLSLPLQSIYQVHISWEEVLTKTRSGEGHKPFTQNAGWRGGRHSSRGRIANFSLNPTESTPEVGAARGGTLGPSHRAMSQPNLSEMGLRPPSRGEGRNRRGRRGEETPQDPKSKPSHRLDFRSLEKILQMEPSEVVMKLAAPGSGLREFLERTENTDPLTHITLDVLSKACSSRTNRQNLQHLLSTVKDSYFLKRTIPMFVMMLGTAAGDQDKREQSMGRLKQIMDLYTALMSTFPSSTVIDVSMAVVLLERELTQLQQAGCTGTEDVQESLANLQRMVAHLQEKKRDGTLRSDSYSLLLGDQDETGVESFRRMSVFPTYSDFHANERPFLRPNKVGETFRDSETYLDTHFRLLREDFLKPLRDGISHLLQFDGKDLRRGRFDDIRMYFSTRILFPVCTPKGILYQVQFHVKSLKMVNWESSKRLLYGALVCLSVDGFESMVFATVANRDVKQLKEGITTLSFTEESRLKLADVSPNDSFLMVETMAFFEAYRHVLEGLKEMSARDLPMQRYIVSCEEDISPPGYLQGHRHVYSLQALMNDDPLKTVHNEKSLPLKQREKLSVLRSFLSKSSTSGSDDTQEREMVGDILDPNDWPSQKDLGLDDSQMKATFVGLKIVKALLDNASIWGSASGSPILVVCYTNHALDQFLEGILRFMKRSSGKLVRVGGRSSSEKLKELSLTNLRRRDNFKRDLPGYLRAMYCELSDQRRDMQRKIGQKAALFESAGKGVLHESVLGDYILSLHGMRLENGQPGGMGESRSKRTRSLMLDWLGISMLSHGSRQMEVVDYSEEFGEDEEERMSVSSDGFREPEEESWNLSPSEIPDGVDVDDADLYQSGGEEVDQNSADDIARATEVLSLAEPVEDEDGDVADLLQVTEEAEQLQAERMMEGDDVHEHIQNARRRLAATQRLVLAYVPGEDQEKEEEEGKPDDYNEGWEITRDMKKKLKNVVKQELQKTDHMLEEDAMLITDLWALPYKQRWHLYRYRSEIRTMVLQYENEYQGIVRRIDELRNREDETVLGNASIIGMTTTSHIVTTLTSACQHLILIGDHQQLRPSATVYELARNFNLEVSLFERLIRMDVPYVRLDYQHRMRPEIARLLTPHIYNKLENHISVNLYENIKGVSTNVFFLDHKELEEHIQEGRSHQNMHEAVFVKSLCYYLICQGYKPSQITVLTTYTGQLFCLKKIMPKSKFEGVNLCVVDRFQGEENDIIILSLVRSNKEGKTGFLKIPNRVCVALSRAKKGLFCIGNMTMLSSVPLWSKIIDTLSSHGQVGEALTLRCENHPATLTPVSKEEDFLKVPFGGCKLPCDFRLACGHVCTKVCHPSDMEHKLYKCDKPCAKTLCQDGHRCPKRCHQECGECQEVVTKTMPRCGHEQDVPCSVSLDKFICRVPCNKILPCGHLCVRGCGETCTRNCPHKVTVDLACGHQRVMLCHVKQDADSKGEQIRCWKKCDAELDCGHPCPGNCFQCAGGSAHLPCTSACNIQLICSHSCERECGRTCVPCWRPCENQCFHRKCQKLCSEACQPCTSPCGWKCKHYECKRLCQELCDRPPCSFPCHKKLKCKHSCIGMCGEPCPKKCRICNAEEVSELFFGNESDPKARFVQLAKCGHIFEVEGFDSWMAAAEANGAIRPKTCPKCQTAIWRGVRYNSLIKALRSDIEAVKRKAAAMWGERIKKEVKEREERGIKSSEISPLLSKLPDVDLRGVAFITKEINPSTRWKMIDEVEGAVQEYDFLKLANWFKCTQGHVRYRQNADFEIVVTDHSLVSEISGLPWYIPTRQLAAYISNSRNAQIVIVGGRAYLHQVCERQNIRTVISEGSSQSQATVLHIKGANTNQQELVQWTPSIWPSWSGNAEDGSIGATSLPPAPSYSPLEAPPPYDAISRVDELKPPPYSECTAQGGATGAPWTAPASAAATPDPLWVSDAPPPYKPLPRMHTATGGPSPPPPSGDGSTSAGP
ncbi:hypothetical protein JZ751_000989 [Albula glossodonta]|uniref:NFX1-type zinc finger-containing protein 1 n=1 Tax=Albula glossodonta TaxID=121402 RepID=A0A8T2PXR1_9TELE|nr:hypothetical protein JZ751_000989 [Albula glossodonta]